MQIKARCVVSLIAGIAILAFSGWAGADPPARVARLGYVNGGVSLSPAGENDWDQATINRPLTSGDRLWTDAGARAEIQIGGATVRMNAATSTSILNLDDRIAQLQLTQGMLNVRVRRLDPDQAFEVDTPNLAFTLRKPGEYRITVDPDGNATSIFVRQGQGEINGEGAAYTIDSRQAYRFTGTGLRDYQLIAAPRPDEFDRWASARDGPYDRPSAARYVSPDVVGYQDLDANGSWLDDARYGKAWVPSHVAADWAPYRDGHWAWVDPWGWTWIDDAPWGFAVSHYGRWAHLRDRWGWVPGPVRGRAYYAPALVAFVGGSNFELSLSGGRVGGIAWFPLAPREVYRPAYPVSRGYYQNVNRSNTVISNIVINNTYINKTTNIVYANRQVPGAIVAVPTTTFVQSQPVGRAAQRIPRDRIASGPVATSPAVAPTEKSIRGNAEAGGKPPARVFERQVIARSAPPAAHPGFVAQQQLLAAQPGKPLDEAARKELKPAAAGPAPIVKVLTPSQEGRPTARPAAPATPSAAIAESARGRSDQRGNAAPRGQATAPPMPAAPLRPSPPQPLPVPAPAVPEQRGRPVAVPPPVPTSPQNAQAAPPAAAEARGRPEQRTPEPRIAPPALSPVPAAPPEPRARQAPHPPAAAPSPPAQHPAEPRLAPAHEARPVPPREASPAHAAPPAPIAAPTRPAPPVRQAEPRPPVAAPPARPPQAAPHVQEPRPEAGRPNEHGGDRQKREEENRKPEK